MSDSRDDVPLELQPEMQRVLRAFVVDGRIVALPSKYAKRLILLDWLAQDFEPGRKYSEQMVNLIIGRRHADTAALRRYLVDEGFMDREAGQYWRAGGTISDRGDTLGTGS